MDNFPCKKKDFPTSTGYLLTVLKRKGCSSSPRPKFIRREKKVCGEFRWPGTGLPVFILKKGQLAQKSTRGNNQGKPGTEPCFGRKTTRKNEVLFHFRGDKGEERSDATRAWGTSESDRTLEKLGLNNPKTVRSSMNLTSEKRPTHERGPTNKPSSGEECIGRKAIRWRRKDDE